MIPKIIHYCWFGRGKMSDNDLRCMATWKQQMPDYDYYLWDEDSFSIADAPAYVQEAYAAKRYAFVSDYARLWALEKMGGIYFDTDVEVLKQFDELLDYQVVIGYERSNIMALGTSMIASEPHSQWVQKQLKHYETIHFAQPDGSYDLTPNPVTILKVMQEDGFVNDGKQQTFMNEVEVFPVDYFSPKDNRTQRIKCTANTYCVHHFAGSWSSKQDKTWIGRLHRLVGDWIYYHCIATPYFALKDWLKRK